MSKNKSTIKIDVELSQEKHPEQIVWEALENEKPVERKAKAMFLSLFDEESFETMKIDLWTTQMQINEMDRFVFHSLRSIAESYFRATKNTELANDMQRFVHYFGEQTGIIPKE